MTAADQLSSSRVVNGSLRTPTAGRGSLRKPAGTVSILAYRMGRPSTTNRARCSAQVYRESAADVSPQYSSGDGVWARVALPSGGGPQLGQRVPARPSGSPVKPDASICSFTYSHTCQLCCRGGTNGFGLEIVHRHQLLACFFLKD